MSHYRFTSPAAWQSHHSSAPNSSYSVPLKSSSVHASSSYMPSPVTSRHRIDRMTDLPKLSKDEKVRRDVRKTAHNIRRRQAAYMRKMARKTNVRPEQILHWHDRLARTPLQRDMVASTVKPTLYPAPAAQRQRVREMRKGMEARHAKQTQRSRNTSALVNTFARTARRAMRSDIKAVRRTEARRMDAKTARRKVLDRVERENWEWVHDQYTEYDSSLMRKERRLFDRAIKTRRTVENAELTRRRNHVAKLHNMEALKRLPLPELAGMRAMLEVSLRASGRRPTTTDAGEPLATTNRGGFKVMIPIERKPKGAILAEYIEIGEDETGEGTQCSAGAGAGTRRMGENQRVRSPPRAPSRGSTRPDSATTEYVPAVAAQDMPFFTTDPRLMYTLTTRQRESERAAQQQLKLAEGDDLGDTFLADFAQASQRARSMERSTIRSIGTRSRSPSGRSSPSYSQGGGSRSPHRDSLDRDSPAGFGDAMDALDAIALQHVGQRPPSQQRIPLRTESRESLSARVSAPGTMHSRDDTFDPQYGGSPVHIRSPMGNMRDPREVRRQRFAQYARETRAAMAVEASPVRGGIGRRK